MLAPAVTVNVEELLELAGENAAAAPAGNPDALKPTALANPFVPLIVSVSLPLVPRVTVRLTLAGESVFSSEVQGVLLTRSRSGGLHNVRGEVPSSRETLTAVSISKGQTHSVKSMTREAAQRIR